MNRYSTNVLLYRYIFAFKQYNRVGMVLCYVLLANDQHIAYLTSTYTNSSMYFIRFLPLNILIQNYIAHLSYLCMCECLCMCAIAYHSLHTILLSLMNCLDTIILNVLQFYQKQPRHITKQSISCMNILHTTITIRKWLAQLKIIQKQKRNSILQNIKVSYFSDYFVLH